MYYKGLVLNQPKRGISIYFMNLAFSRIEQSVDVEFLTEVGEEEEDEETLID